MSNDAMEHCASTNTPPAVAAHVASAPSELSHNMPRLRSMILSTASTDTPKAPCALGTVSAVKTEFHPNFRACREHKNKYFHELLKESALRIVWVRVPPTKRMVSQQLHPQVHTLHRYHRQRGAAAAAHHHKHHQWLAR